ncbi:MAG: hypothetical protein K2Q26_02580 [Bdellovibrionales bacterium]|nr:hypothetical protein [Bdellovibrionales bacterium]
MKKSYDALIIGTSPAALLTAFDLQQQGKSCAVVDANDFLGGVFRPLIFGEHTLSSHLEFIAGETQDFMGLLTALVPEAQLKTEDIGPITFQNGQVQPFLGFGETSFDAIDEGVHLTSPTRDVLNITTADIISAFQQRFLGDILLKSQVTRIDFVDGVVKVQLNIADTITCQNLYFFENPLWLSELLQKGQHSTPKSAIQKLGKTNLWTAVTLTYIHKHPLTETHAMHVLSGAKEQMCFGRFSVEKGQPMSHWLSFANGEIGAESEALGGILREMKHQIKRMYPNFKESVEKEFISVSANAYGKIQSGILDERHQLPKTPQLLLGGRFYSQSHGLSGDFSTMNFNPPPNVVELTEMPATI